MLKKALLAVFVLIPIWLISQDMPFTVRSNTKYSISGMVGYEKVDSVKYLQLRLIQEFKYKKFGLGIDLDFLLDKKNRLKTDEWDHLSDALNKIYYFRYSEKGEPFYFHLGGFPNNTISNGLVMLNYSNMLLYPDLRNTGLMMGGSPQWPLKPSFEIFTSNLEKNQILSFSTHVKPVPDSTFIKLNNFEVGFSIVADRNQYGNLKYVVSDSLYDVTDKSVNKSVSVYSFDYILPILERDNITLGNYAEIAHIAGYGNGLILPGLYTDFKFIKVNLEYRMYEKQFIPAFFDHYYEEQRAAQVGEDEDVVVMTKEELLDAVKASYGWYGKVQGFIGKKAKVLVAWQDMYGKDLKTGKSFWFKLWVDTQYKRLEKFSLAYSKINVEKMSPGNVIVPSSNVAMSLTFSLNEKRRWFMIGKYSEKYKDRNGNGEINWTKETKRSAAIGVKYTF